MKKRRLAFSSIILGTVLVLSCSQESLVDIEIEKIVSSIQLPVFPDADFIVDAVPDGVTDAREAINNTISMCSSSGGGRVVLRPGRYFCKGPIQLKSDVNLHLEDGCEILFSPDPKDYTPMELTVWEGTELVNYCSPINAYQCENIAITGKGVLNGQAVLSPFGKGRHTRGCPQVMELRRLAFSGVPAYNRGFGENSVLPPAMLQPWGCNKILLEDITILDSPFWCIHCFYCYNVTLRRVKINSQHLNNDGFDPDCSSYILVEDCDFNCLDDAIAVKAARDKDGWRSGKKSHDIVIRNCRFSTGSGGIVIGSEMSAGVYRVYAKDIKVSDCRTLFSIRGNLDRGGFVRDIYVDNVEADSVCQSVFFLNHRYVGLVGGNTAPKVSNVVMSNCKVRVSADAGITFHGLSQEPAQDFLFENIQIGSCPKPLILKDAGRIEFRNVSMNGRIMNGYQSSTEGVELSPERGRKHHDFDR